MATADTDLPAPDGEPENANQNQSDQNIAQDCVHVASGSRKSGADESQDDGPKESPPQGVERAPEADPDTGDPTSPSKPTLSEQGAGREEPVPHKTDEPPAEKDSEEASETKESKEPEPHPGPSSDVLKIEVHSGADNSDAEARKTESSPLETAPEGAVGGEGAEGQLNVELPPLDKADSEGGAEGGANGARGNDSSGAGVYHTKWINFKKKQVPIVTQNENGPCPLLAIINVLLLQNRLKLTQNADLVTVNQLMAYLGECVLENVPSEGVAESARLNFEQNMQDAMTVMYKLQTGLDVNVRFTGVRDFEYTTECIIFDLLQISLYHGWLVDPQNKTEVDAVGKCSYNQLVEKIISQKVSDKPELVSEALVAEQFLDSSASQLTYHGLCELSSSVKQDELCVLFRNNHFTTLYKHKNELFQLVTDQGFLSEANVVWETLSNVEGDCHFVDSEFRTYTKPEPEPVLAPSHSVSPEEQIDHDYLVALSLQQEQQIGGGIPQDQMAWGQMDAQQQPQISDLELARSLQEEERRAAEAEAASRPQQPQHQRSPPPTAASSRGPQGQGQRRPREQREHREEKKSDCSIL